MEINELMRRKMVKTPEFKELPPDDYITKLYEKFIDDVENHEDYSVVVFNDFGIYFANRFPGLESLLILSDDHDLMDLEPLEDRICNNKFVMFVPQDSSEMYWVQSAIGSWLGEVEHIYAVYSDRMDVDVLYGPEDLLDSPIRYGCPYLGEDKNGFICRSWTKCIPEKDCRDCRLWTNNWRREMMLRTSSLIEHTCVHGVGHPNPFAVMMLDRLYGLGGMGIHGCDGCCSRNDFPGRPRADEDYWMRGDSYAVERIL